MNVWWGDIEPMLSQCWARGGPRGEASSKHLIFRSVYGQIELQQEKYKYHGYELQKEKYTYHAYELQEGKYAYHA